VAEGARLESVYTGNRIVGSNPTPSATSESGIVHSCPMTQTNVIFLKMLLSISV
jgi:hypothetical protein